MRWLLGALWGHECGRVFCDKMNTPEDKAWVEGAFADLARRGGRRCAHTLALHACMLL